MNHAQLSNKAIIIPALMPKCAIEKGTTIGKSIAPAIGVTATNLRNIYMLTEKIFLKPI